ncbi:MAG TPA: hypothetical protein VN642_14925, partial [Dongiaceae bacterium]|nr:hypothetical protein [Dongiaceae bacterium]
MNSIPDSYCEQVDNDGCSWTFWAAFFIAALSYLNFLFNRGFGWDGDSFVSAAQFVKFMNNRLDYPYDVLGTHPKILTILVFGIFYQLSHSFVYLTFLAITINSIMVAVICKWVKETGGLWIIALIGLVINYDWSLIVVNCDNPAFSVPFIIFGLYSYYGKNHKITGAILLLVSSLFRPGSEIILLLIMLLEAKSSNFRPITWLSLITATLICIINTLFGIYLVFTTKEQFIRACVEYYPEAKAQIPIYKHSIRALFYYLQSVFNQLSTFPDILFSMLAGTAIFGLIKHKNPLRFIALAPMASLLLPIGIFVYGVTVNTQAEKHMEYVIVLPALASFSFVIPRYIKYKSLIISITAVVSTLILLCISSGLVGAKLHGKYEIGR